MSREIYWSKSSNFVWKGSKVSKIPVCSIKGLKLPCDSRFVLNVNSNLILYSGNVAGHEICKILLNLLVM